MTTPSVFISYSHAEAEDAEKVRAVLASFGIATISLDEQIAANDIAIETENAIRQSYAVLVILSRHSRESEAIDEAIALAQELKDERLVVASLDGTQPAKRWLAPYLFVESPWNPQQIAERLYKMRPPTWSTQDEPIVHFAADIDPIDAAKVLTALSNYWRECGGIGLPVECDLQEADIEVPTHA